MSYPFLPDSYEDLFYRAMALARGGEVEGAIDLYGRLVERLARLSADLLARRPQLSQMQMKAGVELAGLLHSQGRFAEAITVAEGLLRTHPERSQEWRRDIAVLRLAKGEADRGLGELQALAEEQPDKAWNWILLGNEARIEGRFPESQAAFGRALEAAGGQDGAALRGEAHYGRFRLFKDIGQPDDAVAAWEEAVAHNPDLRRTVHEVATMLTEAGRTIQARSFVDRDENKIQGGFQRGILAELSGDNAKARQEWQAVAALDPLAFEYGQECWMEAVLRLGDPLPALERLQQLVRQHGSVRLMVLSGMAWAMRGNREVAQKLFEESMQLLRRSRPPRQKLDSADWRLLTSLVADEELRSTLKPYFAVVETIWGEGR